MTARRILITGGAGLVGSTITDLLLAEEPGIGEIVVFDDFSRGHKGNLARALESGKVRVVRGDIRNEAQLDQAMRGIDYVFHLAAIKIVRCAQEPRVANDVLVNGTLNVLEAARANGVQKIIASSTASVYGQAELFPTSESHHPYNNRTLYGAAKAYNEGMYRAYNEMYGLDYIALRYFNIYGPRMDTEGLYTEVLVRWMDALARGERPIMHGDGSTSVDFVNVRDVARANLAAFRSSATDEVFNVGSGVETTLKRTIECLAEVMGVAPDIQHEPMRKLNGVAKRCADISKAKELLGWEPTVSLEEGLAELVQWWQISKGSSTDALPIGAAQ